MKRKVIISSIALTLTMLGGMFGLSSPKALASEPSVPSFVQSVDLASSAPQDIEPEDDPTFEDFVERLYIVALGRKAEPNAIKFATRLYTCCLKREPEVSGLSYWSLALTNLEQTGCSAAKAFFFSKEFDAMNVSDGKFVDRLYQTFMDRKPSNEERNYWVKKLLYTLYTRREAIVFFGNSEEFANICATYGIDQGTM